ncbi:MAG: hypothetical protein ABI969_02020 [bacterium]
MNLLDRADVDDQSSWPYRDILLFGYFGSGTPEGRRHRNRTFAWLAVFMGAALVATFDSLSWSERFFCGVAVPVAVAAIVWSSVRYVSELDELSRLIYLQATAFSYGAVVVLAGMWFSAGALGLAEHIPGPHARSTLAVWVLPSLLLAEALRGLALVHFARSRR